MSLLRHRHTHTRRWVSLNTQWATVGNSWASVGSLMTRTTKLGRTSFCSSSPPSGGKCILERTKLLTRHDGLSVT